MQTTTSTTHLVRVAALLTGYDNRVRVLFAEREEGRIVYSYGLEMDRETYRAIPYTQEATPDTFREIAASEGHRAIIEAPDTFDDLFTYAKQDA
jgi:hypothetical protein